MGVNWIVQIDCDKCTKDIFIKSSATKNVGLLKDTTTGGSFTLDDHQWKVLTAGHSYEVSHCGVPWIGTGAITFSSDKYAGWNLYVKNDVAQMEDMKSPNPVTSGDKLGSRVVIALSDGSGGYPGIDFN